jgi:hypothetical protein
MVSSIEEMMASTIISFVAIAVTVGLVLGSCNFLTADIVYGQPTIGDDSFTAQKTAVSKAGTYLYIKHTKQRKYFPQETMEKCGLVLFHGLQVNLLN